MLINRFGTIPELAVRPTSAVRKYAEVERDPLSAGRELGVDAILEGNIQRDGNRVRVTAELRRVPSGESLWAGKFDEQYRDAFALEDAIVSLVADAVVVDLTGANRLRLLKRYTDNSDAWQAYLRGRYFWNRRTPEDHQKAIAEFEQATRIDPRYALAYAGLADAYVLLGSNSNRVMTRREAITKARAAALKALDIDPELRKPTCRWPSF